MNIEFFVTCFFFQKLAIFGFVLKSDQKANHSQMYKKMTIFKKILCLKVFMKNPFSLSKLSNYPSSIRKILAMSQNGIQEILSQKLICNFGKVFKYLWNFGYVQEKFYGPEISKKNRIVQGVWIFSRILHKHWLLLNIVIFIHPAMISL